MRTHVWRSKGFLPITRCLGGLERGIERIGVYCDFHNIRDEDEEGKKGRKFPVVLLGKKAQKEDLIEKLALVEKHPPFGSKYVC